jgi:hypothetical protein
MQVAVVVQVLHNLVVQQQVLAVQAVVVQEMPLIKEQVLLATLIKVAVVVVVLIHLNQAVLTEVMAVMVVQVL